MPPLLLILVRVPTAWVCANGLGSWSGPKCGHTLSFPTAATGAAYPGTGTVQCRGFGSPCKIYQGHLPEPKEVTAAQGRVENFERE